ncbi:MAG: hypothetical protein C0605_16215, partial [Hyphomicrobiales bacterium]
QWHLDKRVPIAMITVIAVQTFGAIWWAATLTGTVTFNTARIERFEASYSRMAAMEQTLARIDERLKSLQSVLERARRGNP